MEDVRRLPVGEDNEITVTLDDLAREGARRMIAAALRAEADEYVASFADELDEHGKRLVVRNGRARERRVTVGSGTIAVRAPRVNDKRVDEETGERKRFSSRILPAYARRSPKVTDVLPMLYLRGLSTGDFAPRSGSCSARTPPGCRRRSAGCARTGGRACALPHRALKFRRYAYLFVDGVHVAIRLGEDDRRLLVVIGVREDGVKELLAVEDGYRESTERWAVVMRDLKDRGLNEPKLVCGDGALGAWARSATCSRTRAASRAGCTDRAGPRRAPQPAAPRRDAAARDHGQARRGPTRRPRWSASARSSTPSTPRPSPSSTATGRT